MTALIIESSLLGLAARSLGEWKRGPLLRLAEAQMHSDLRSEGAAIYGHSAVKALSVLRIQGHAPVIFGPLSERGVLDLLDGWGFTVYEATGPALLNRTPRAITNPWLATVATRGRLPHALRSQVVTAAQLGLTPAHTDRALRLHPERTR